MANFLLPGRAGDLARCVLVGPTGSFHDSSRTLATLAVEKVLDGLALVGPRYFKYDIDYVPVEQRLAEMSARALV